jgi:hypothetical protein
MQSLSQTVVCRACSVPFDLAEPGAYASVHTDGAQAFCPHCGVFEIFGPEWGRKYPVPQSVRVRVDKSVASGQ